MKLSNVLLMFCIALFVGTDMNAQELKFPKLDPSPMDMAHYPRRAAFQNYLDADDPDRTQKIKVLYCRPNKKGRDVFGGLEPFGKDWRLGANEATEVTFFQPVEIAGTTVPGGTYTMSAKLQADHWIINISTERFIGGAENRDTKKDIVNARVELTKMPEVREEFTIGFQKVDEGNVNMLFEWDKTRATLPINLNAASLANGPDKSPMDLVQYPNMSRLRNYVKPEELEANEPQVRVVYSRPQMKGRKVFGELLKYGEMWRVGANETTLVTFYNDVTIGGKKVRRGTYGLFAKVNENNWEFIIHKNTQSWGNAQHDEKDNVVTVVANVEKTPAPVEALSILLVENGTDKLDLIVGWENSMAKLPIMLK